MSNSIVEDPANQIFPCLDPVYPEMRDTMQRISTFQEANWPRGDLRATPRDLGEAGFFYLCEWDKVTCWYCGGELQNWDTEGRPWMEHARWYPNCEFLLQQKGLQFVENIQSSLPHSQTTPTNNDIYRLSYSINIETNMPPPNAIDLSMSTRLGPESTFEAATGLTINQHFTRSISASQRQTSCGSAAVSSSRLAVDSSSGSAEVLSSRPASARSFVPTRAPSFRSAAAPFSRPAAASSFRPGVSSSSRPAAALFSRPTAASFFTTGAAPFSRHTAAPSFRLEATPFSRHGVVPSYRPGAVPYSGPGAAPASRHAAVPSFRPEAAPCFRHAAAPSFRHAAGLASRPAPVPFFRSGAEPSARNTSVPFSRPEAAPFSRHAPVSSSRHAPVPSSRNTSVPSSGNTPVPSSRPDAAPPSRHAQVSFSIPEAAPSSRDAAGPSYRLEAAPSSRPAAASRRTCLHQSRRHHPYRSCCGFFRTDRHEQCPFPIIDQKVASFSRQNVARTLLDISSREGREFQQSRLCKICAREEPRVIFLPCNHVVCCSACAKGRQVCPVCGDPIAQQHPAYYS